MRPVLSSVSPTPAAGASDICVFLGQPGSGGSVCGALYVLESAGDKPRSSSTGGTARLAAEATNGDWVPGNSLLSGAVTTANIMVPATAAADTIPPHRTTRAVQGRSGRSIVRRRTSSQLASDGALPSTRPRR